MYRLLFIFILSGLLLGCETFHGLSKDGYSFPPMTPEINQCIEKTIRADQEVNFNRAYKTDDNTTTTFGGESIYSTIYYYIYDLKTLDCKGCHFQMYVNYGLSNDKEHTKTRISHSFGGLNTKYTEEQKKIAKIAMDRLENSLQKRCGLANAFTQ